MIQFRPRQTESYYVQFNFNSADHSGTCEANVGYTAAAQPENVTGSVDCNQGVLLHEMAHIVGLYHEQSRPDRDQFVSVLFQNIIKGSRSNFEQVLDNSQVFGLYDYGSIMHYIPFAFSRNGGPTIESIPAGIPLSTSGASATYTAGDIDGIKRLYNGAPTAVTITSDPPGLHVIVDGVTVTTPQAFNWAFNSTHTLNIAGGVQTVGSQNYAFARWNDTAWTGAVQPSHSITVVAGSGLLASPVTSPAITVYSAAFTQLIHYTPSTSPPGGSITSNPLPQTIGGNQYFTAHQPVQLTAAPPGGYAFYSWFGSFDGILPFGLNPMTTSHLLDNDIGANFVNSLPLTMVGTNLQNAGLGVQVDGSFWYAPKNFTNFEWTGPLTHSLSVDSPQQPYSSDTRYVFANWNGTLPANPLIVSSTPQQPSYTANFNPEYRLTKSVSPSCAGTIMVSQAPMQPDFTPTVRLSRYRKRPTPAGPSWAGSTI